MNTTRIVIRNARSPYQFALVAVSATAGCLGLVLPVPGPSNNIPRVFGAATAWFYAALLISSMIVAAGMMWPRGSSTRFRFGLELERVGQWPLGGAAFAYAATNLAVAGPTALVSALLTGGIGVAALVRVYTITIDLRRVTELLALDADRRGR